jgi:DNA-binding winged helix-turn-helix (wHTH) protein
MARKLLRFESFTLDLERLCLRGPSGQMELRRKSFEVMRYLLEHTGRVIAKDEVIKAVWPDVTVSDESLAQCISEVRRALGDESQRIIKTVPRRGYVIDVPIGVSDAASSEAGCRTLTDSRVVGRDATIPPAAGQEDTADRRIPETPAVGSGVSSP